jgi:propanol-preferring alcohol dehydrogenase
MSVPILDCVINGIELVGTVVGTRQDMQEALELAKHHKITCKIQKRKLEDINEIFEDMNNYKISGRVVLDLSAK